MTGPAPAGGPGPSVTALEFGALARFLYGVSGIHLEPDKAYLVETRLGPLCEELGGASFSELLYRLKTDRSGALVGRMLDAITTNETRFFRDQAPFELLRDLLLPAAIARQRAAARPGAPAAVRVWSAACSTGQEAYSVAMLAHELGAPGAGVEVEVLGTDLSGAAVARAAEGRYGEFEVERGLDPARRDRFLERQAGAGWRVSPEIRALCTFRRQNLHEPFAALGQFDLVLCRNVGIYFRLEDRRALFHRIADAVAPQGALLIGASEFLTGVSDRFVPRRHGRAVYYALAGGGDR
ncbi:MAG: CheR family methyltransferase [Deferrisomatales bacterium]